MIGTNQARIRNTSMYQIVKGVQVENLKLTIQHIIILMLMVMQLKEYQQAPMVGFVVRKDNLRYNEDFDLCKIFKRKYVKETVRISNNKLYFLSNGLGKAALPLKILQNGYKQIT